MTERKLTIVASQTAEERAEQIGRRWRGLTLKDFEPKPLTLKTLMQGLDRMAIRSGMLPSYVRPVTTEGTMTNSARIAAIDGKRVTLEPWYPWDWREGQRLELRKPGGAFVQNRTVAQLTSDGLELDAAVVGPVVGDVVVRTGDL